MWAILFIILALVIGYWLGKNAEQDRTYKEDPDDDVNPDDGSLQLLLFTKKERYDLGRALVIGNKKEQVEAKKRLENAVARTHSIAADVRFERLKEEGKYPRI